MSEQIWKSKVVVQFAGNAFFYKLILFDNKNIINLFNSLALINFRILSYNTFYT